MVKIFSNFDSEIDDKLLAVAEERFGKENVCFIRRDPIYIVLRVILPTIGRLIFITFILFIVYGTPVIDVLWRVAEWLVWIVVAVTWLYLASHINTKFVDYYFDFTIMTPKQIVAYDQTWIFQRSSRALDISKIKSVRVDKKWLLKSIFNYWSIIFFAEWDSDLWDIRLNYISNPQSLEKRLSHILHLAEVRKEGNLVDDADRLGAVV